MLNPDLEADSALGADLPLENESLYLGRLIADEMGEVVRQRRGAQAIPGCAAEEAARQNGGEEGFSTSSQDDPCHTDEKNRCPRGCRNGHDPREEDAGHKAEAEGDEGAATEVGGFSGKSGILAQDGFPLRQGMCSAPSLPLP